MTRPPPFAVVVQKCPADSPLPKYFEELQRRMGRAFPKCPHYVVEDSSLTAGDLLKILKQTGARFAVRIIGSTAALDETLTRRMAKYVTRHRLDYVFPLRFPLGFLPAEIVSRKALVWLSKRKPEHPFAFKELRRIKPKHLNVGAFRFEMEMPSDRKTKLYAHRYLFPPLVSGTRNETGYVEKIRSLAGGSMPPLKQYIQLLSNPRRFHRLYLRHFPGYLFGIHSGIGRDSPDSYEAWWKTVKSERMNPMSGVGTPVPQWESPEIYRKWVLADPETNIITKMLRLTRKDRVLDFGCGLGRHAVALSGQVGKYVGVDASMDALKFARARTRGLSAVFFRIDDNLLPFEDNSFDAAYAWQVFVHVEREDLLDILQELRRVLKPGGRLLFTHENFSAHYASWKNFQAKNLGAWKVQRRYEPRLEEEIRLIAADAGFDVRVFGGRRYLCRVQSR